MIANALKQKNVAGGGFFVYRQKNPQEVADALGLEGSVQQSMTHDAHLLCGSAEAADRSERTLKAAQVGDRALFFVERVDPTRVFYQLDIEHDVPRDAQIVVMNRTIPFYDLFELICERTGAHVPEGDVYFEGITMPSRLPNHAIFDAITGYFE